MYRYQPGAERRTQRFNRRLTLVAVLSTLLSLLVVGVYGLEHSQLASPNDGPVQFYWVIKGTDHGCLVLDKGTVEHCDKFTYDQRQHFPLHWEDPRKSFPEYFKK